MLIIVTNKYIKCSVKGKKGGRVDDVGVLGVIKFRSWMKIQKIV